MKKAIKFFTVVVPVLAMMLISNMASAQVSNDLTTKQTELQAYIATASARISDPVATANMTPQAMADFQASIDEAQAKLASINETLAQQAAIAERDAQQTLLNNRQAQFLQDQNTLRPGTANDPYPVVHP